MLEQLANKDLIELGTMRGQEESEEGQEDDSENGYEEDRQKEGTGDSQEEFEDAQRIDLSEELSKDDKLVIDKERDRKYSVENNQDKALVG